MALPRMTQRVLSRARVYVYDLTSDQEDRRPDNLRRAVAWLLLLFGEAVKFTQNPASRTLLTFRLARKRRSGLRSGAGIENSEWHGLPSAGFFRTCLLVPPSRIPFARAHSLSDLQTNGCIHKDTPTFLRSCRPIPSCPRTRSSSGRVSEPLKLGPGGNRVPPGSIKVLIEFRRRVSRVREQPLVSLDHAPAGVAAAGLRAAPRERDPRAWPDHSHRPKPKPPLRPGRVLIDPPDDLIAVERLKIRACRKVLPFTAG
jgi:hypothetical protein